VEYVRVRFPEIRTVFVDGRPAGRTNETLVIEAGTHEVDLGQPGDYAPSKKLVIVTNTTSISPVEINFVK